MGYRKMYSVRWTYSNGRKETVRLQVRTLQDAIRYVDSINSQTNMKAEILRERKVVWTY